MTGRRADAWVVVECQTCKKEFDRRRCRISEKMFCSHSCAAKYRNLMRWGEPVLKHGTFRAYNVHRCRCTECRQTWNSYVTTREKNKRRENKVNV